MFTEILLALIAIALSIPVFRWIQNRSRFRKLINRIPGPPCYAIVGNLPTIVTLKENDMWDYFRQLSKDYYPIYKLWNGYIASVALLDPDDIEVVLSSSKHLRKTLVYKWLQPWLGTGLLTSTGSKWKSRRRILTPAFHFNILQQFLDVFVEQSEILVKSLEKECDKPYTEIFPVITEFALHSICETAMGTRLDVTTRKAKEYISAIYRMGEIIALRIRRPWYHMKLLYLLSSIFREQKELVKVLHKFSMGVIEEREKNFATPEVPTDNKETRFKSRKRLAMLDLLISAKKSGESIGDEGIREEVDTFMFEGHDTTTSAICFTLMLLANYPDIQERVIQELREALENPDRPLNYQDLQKLTYLEMVIKESLRMYPSVPLITRITDEDIRTSSGYLVPANTFIHIHIFDLHYNPKFYPDPYRFDPQRFSPENLKGRHPFAYLPFSAGPRNCIGQRYAMLELKTIVASILRKYVLKAVDNEQDIKMIVHLVLKTQCGIRLKLEKRSHCI